MAKKSTQMWGTGHSCQVLPCEHEHVLGTQHSCRMCIGTWLYIKQMLRHVIEATIITGCAKGQNVFILCIPLMPTDTPCDFQRLQLPLKLCFAMSISKTQGQSLRVAGVDLMNKCFSHGLLKVGSHSNLHIQAPQGKTENVVYKEALQNSLSARSVQATISCKNLSRQGCEGLKIFFLSVGSSKASGANDNCGMMLTDG